MENPAKFATSLSDPPASSEIAVREPGGPAHGSKWSDMDHTGTVVDIVHRQESPVSVFLYLVGHRAFRARKLVVAIWAALVLLAGGAAAVLNQGTDNNVTIPGTEAQLALDQLSHTFPQVSGSSGQVVLVASEGRSVRDKEFAGPIGDTVEALAQVPGVVMVTDPLTDGTGMAVSSDDSTAIVNVQLDRPATEVDDALRDDIRGPVDQLRTELPKGSTVVIGGNAFSISMPRVGATEGIGLLVALVVLVITFGSFLVAGMPLVTALTGVAITVSGILAMTRFTTLSSTTPLLALMLGLAVGIDYALFIISRHVDQVRHGMEPEEAAARSVATAGSAVVFAGLTVIVALVGLSVTGIPFLTIMGIAAAVGVALAVLVSLTLVPALLGFAGNRVAHKLGGRRHRTVSESAQAARAVHENRALGGWVRASTRWPAVTIVVVIVGMLVIASPARSLRLALPDAGSQPAATEVRQAYDLVAEKFGPGYNGPLIVTGSILHSTDPLGLMADLKAELETVPGVALVPLATPNATADTGIVEVIPDSAPDSQQTADLVHRIRDMRPQIEDEHGFTLAVTGFTAAGVDISALLGRALLPFGLLVVGLCLFLLALVFRSVWVPVTAAAGYLLSVAAAFGVVVAVFEHGVAADLLNVARPGPVISFMPIIVMGVLFGLAMDYQVFLVSRMREEYVHGGDAREAVRRGFLGSGKVVTAAAVIMFAVFASFVPHGDGNIKPIALGLALGVLFDAFVVRMTLMPAVLHLLGDRAWWLPRWLDRLLPSLDVEGEALERELALADWPEDPGPDGRVWAIAADDLRAPGQPVSHPGARVRVPAGSALAVIAERHQEGTALALALSGRMPLPDGTGGTVKVAGYLLPERGTAVRRRTSLALLDGVADRLEAIRLALAERPELLFVDRIDLATEPHERRGIRAALEQAVAEHPDLCVVVTCADPSALDEVLPLDLAVGLTTLHLSPHVLEESH